MTKLKVTLVAALLVATLGATWFLQRQTHQSLRARHEALLAQTAQLDALKVENQRWSNRAGQATNHTPSDPQKRELLRLRGEVAQLRAETNQIETLRQELERLRAAQAELAKTQTPTAAAPDTFPRETWAFASWVTPESAIQTSSWASLRGDLVNFYKSMTPKEKARIRQEWDKQGKGDKELGEFLVGYWSQIKAVRIEQRQLVSENEVVLDLLMERENGRSQMVKMKVQRIDNEWRLAGPPDPDAGEE